MSEDCPTSLRLPFTRYHATVIMQVSTDPGICFEFNDCMSCRFANSSVIVGVVFFCCRLVSIACVIVVVVFLTVYYFSLLLQLGSY